jgi:hypothetical protein
MKLAGENFMAKDVITRDGQEIVVREDTAKAYRFVRWGVITAAMCLVLMALLLAVTLVWKWGSN